MLEIVSCDSTAACLIVLHHDILQDCYNVQIETSTNCCRIENRDDCNNYLNVANERMIIRTLSAY